MVVVVVMVVMVVVVVVSYDVVLFKIFLELYSTYLKLFLFIWLKELARASIINYIYFIL